MAMLAGAAPQQQPPTPLTEEAVSDAIPEPAGGEALPAGQNDPSSQNDSPAPSGGADQAASAETPAAQRATVPADPRVAHYRLQARLVEGQVELERITRRAAARDSFLALAGTLVFSLTSVIGGIVLVALERVAAGMLAIGGSLAVLLVVFLVYRPARKQAMLYRADTGAEASPPSDAPKSSP